MHNRQNCPACTTLGHVRQQTKACSAPRNTHLSAAKDPAVEGPQALVHCKLHRHVRDVLQQRRHKPLHTAAIVLCPLGLMQQIICTKFAPFSDQVYRAAQHHEEGQDNAGGDWRNGTYREEAADTGCADEGLGGCNGVGVQPGLDAADAYCERHLHHAAAHRRRCSSHKCQAPCMVFR